jgi:hypothetical protein
MRAGDHALRRPYSVRTGAVRDSVLCPGPTDLAPCGAGPGLWGLRPLPSTTMAWDISREEGVHVESSQLWGAVIGAFVGAVLGLIFARLIMGPGIGVYIGIGLGVAVGVALGQAVTRR